MQYIKYIQHLKLIKAEILYIPKLFISIYNIIFYYISNLLNYSLNS